MLTGEYLAASPRRRWVTRTALDHAAGPGSDGGLRLPDRAQPARGHAHRMTGQVRRAAADRPPHRSAHPGLRPARAQTLVHPDARSEAPDLIVITGDTVDKGAAGAGPRPAGQPVGARWGSGWCAATGSAGPLQEDERAFYASAGRALPGQQRRAGAGRPLDGWAGRSRRRGEPDLDKALARRPRRGLQAGADARARLLPRDRRPLRPGAGRAHPRRPGACCPASAPFWLPPGGQRYVRGWYTRNGSQLFVSRGIGTSIVPAALPARPELAIIEVTPALTARLDVAIATRGQAGGGRRSARSYLSTRRPMRGTAASTCFLAAAGAASRRRS